MGKGKMKDRGLPAPPVFPALSFSPARTASLLFVAVIYILQDLSRLLKRSSHKDRNVCVLFTVLTLAPRTVPDTEEVSKSSLKKVEEDGEGGR